VKAGCRSESAAPGFFFGRQPDIAVPFDSNPALRVSAGLRLAYHDKTINFVFWSHLCAA